MPRLLPLLALLLPLLGCVRVSTGGAATFPTTPFESHGADALLAEVVLAEGGATERTSSNSRSVMSNSFGRSVALDSVESEVTTGEGGAVTLLDALQLRFVEVVADGGASVQQADAPVADEAGVTSAVLEYELGDVVGRVLMTATPTGTGTTEVAVAWEEILE